MPSSRRVRMAVWRDESSLTRPLSNFFIELNEFLLEKNREGTNVALVIDEAQDLSPQVLEQVRLLSNLETDQHKLIQIVL